MKAKYNKMNMKAMKRLEQFKPGSEKKRLILVLLSLVWMWACSSDEKKGVSSTGEKQQVEEVQTSTAVFPSTTERTGEAQWTQLVGEDIYILLPPGFKHGDRPHIKDEIPAMKTDPLLSVPLQGGIDDLRSEDDFPDLFIDTLLPYRFVLVHNFDPLKLDAEVQEAIEKYLAKRMDFLSKLVRTIDIERLSIDYTETEQHNRFKVRYLISDKEDPQHRIWISMYFIATKQNAYYIFMASQTEEDLENYLTSLREEGPAKEAKED